MGKKRTEINSEPMKRMGSAKIDCDKILNSVFTSQKDRQRMK